MCNTSETLFCVLVKFLFCYLQTEYFFVPTLSLLSEKLKLSPSIAGITLLAFGNGAPDVFTSYAGLKHDKTQLVLGYDILVQKKNKFVMK